MSEKHELWRTIDRRRFLKYCAALGAGVVAGGALQTAFDVMRIGPRRLKVSMSRLRMGTYVTITAIQESQSLAEESIGRAFEEMDRLIGILSRHDASTALAVLNDTGSLASPPSELVEVVRRSHEFHAQTGGAFDVTVAPLVDLFKRSGQAGRLPDDGEIEDALSLVGADELTVSAARVGLARSGMSVTLDGIAKGYIVDRVSDTLVQCGVDNHLVNAGGDIRTRGYRSEARPWTIAIEDPEKKGNHRDVIQLTNGAVATSGDYEIYYDKERILGHVVDPRTGRSPRQSTSASVVAESVMRADALSTAALVMEPVSGMRLIESLPASECLLIDHDGKRRRTRHWQSFSVQQST